MAIRGYLCQTQPPIANHWTRSDARRGRRTGLRRHCADTRNRSARSVPTWSGPLAHLADELDRALVEPDQRTLPPASAAKNNICARSSLRAACLPPLKSAASSVRSARLSSTDSVHSSCLLLSRHGRRAESEVSHSAKAFTPKQGQYLAFIVDA